VAGRALEIQAAERDEMRLLLVEDATPLQRALGTGLRKEGYVVDVTGDGQEGLWLAQTHEYDLIILDLMLPGLEGLALLGQLRDSGKRTHVLILTAKDTVADRVRGLRAGADDYLVKPFAFEEFLARVHALCRRGYGRKQTRLVVGDLEVDLVAKLVRRAGQVIQLKPREYALLELLVLRQGEVVSRSEIEAHIYDETADPMSNVVDSAVCSLRKKLSLPDSAPLIHTRHGLGYVLENRSS
jgi:DNA-binding response OmpR family regulator